MENENITPETLPETGSPESDSQGAVGSEGSGDAKVGAMTLTELNSLLGKNFSDKETALKSIKDTFSYVGKKTDTVKEDLSKSGYMTKEQFENELFFRDNPEHSKNKDVLEALAKAKGVTLREASQNESYKQLHENSANFEKGQSLKSTLEPNPRLASAVGRGQKVAESMKSGQKDIARTEAAKAVIEAFGLDQ